MKKSNNLVKNIKHNKKGITLVALVITTIVLLILAGVVVKLSIGDNGVVSRTKDAANKYDASQSYEMGIFNDIANEYDQIVSGNWSIGGSGGNTGGENQGSGTGNTTTPGGEEKPDNPGGSGNLSGEENNKLEENGIKELTPSEITNDNLKDNDNIKAVITGEVPIPTGANYKEETKDTGVVVEFGESEFVWVPVPDINEMVTKSNDETPNYSAIQYEFSGSTVKKYENPTNWQSTKEAYTEPSSNYQTLTTINNILGTNYTAKSEFTMDLQRDFNNMAISVEKYKGFFIGRYETSMDTETKATYSKKGVLPLTMITPDESSWSSFYAYQKKMAEINDLNSVESYMIWGCNYDAMLKWALTGADASKVYSKGNAVHDLSSVYETGKETVLNKTDRINNIYDLEGNGGEYTCEAFSYYKSGTSSTVYGRTIRGSCFSRDYVAIYPSTRNSSNLTSNFKNAVCSRLMLYIK